jgi:LacI family transcriptional regulator
MARKRVTLREVAKTAGVHVSTVSRALDPNSRHLINAEIVTRIQRISQALDYRPNAAAYTLKTKRTRTIGVIIPDITNAIFPPIIRGIEDSLALGGYVAIVGNTDGAHERERALLDTFLARGVDGLILASVERDDDALERATAESTPMVTVNRQVDRDNVSSVVHDETEGIRRVLTHLASLGHRRIAMVAGPQTSSTGARRYAAFRQFSAALRLEADDRLVAFAAAYNEAAGEQGVEELIAGGGAFTAIVCGNDRLAIGAIAALARLRLKCPEDVSVTGYNDMAMVDRIDPPLTTIRIQQYRMGREAGAMLQRMIDGQIEAEHVVLPVELMIRGSTAAARRDG